MFRSLICSAVALGTLQGAELPAWWRSFLNLPRLESPFLQESDSAVFGKLKRTGTLHMAQGGRLRVEYRKGLLLVTDGRSLVQYDPEARTVQRLDLRRAAVDAPLLRILVQPKALETAFRILPGPGPQSVTLEPRSAGIPTVVLEGEGALLKRVRWTDATGAKQMIELQSPKVPGALDAGLFTFKAPAGTRWLGRP